MTDGLVVESDQIVGPQRRERVGVTIAIHKLDFGIAGRVHLDDGAYLAAREALLGKIPKEGDDGEKF